MAFKDFELSRYGGRPDEFYQFSLVGGPTYRYTPMRLPVQHLGQTYQPKAIRKSEFTWKKDFSGEDSMTIEVQADLELLKHFQIIVPRKTMFVTIFRKHRGDPEGEAVPVFFGRVRGVSKEGAKAVITCDAFHAMTKRGGLNWWYQVTCNHFLYDGGCGLIKDDWKVTGTVSSLNGTTLVSPMFASKPNGYFKYGHVETVIGDWFIIDHVGDTVTLLHAMEGVSVGEFISGYAGCDRTLNLCWDRFNNGLNHLGFTWSPADNVFVDGI